ncbi:MAG: hypothetical protein K1X64_13275 [Myxococcaceae bacterium]|nr:hypothetical protein [Myxococcaceae bacterium]
MENSSIIPVANYLLYLAVSIATTAWVARTLHKNGRTFLVDAFDSNEALADSVNRLLVVGFYLINIGYVSLAMKVNIPPVDVASMLESLTSKIGVVLLVLGGMHFGNLWIFSKIRARGQLKHQPPPVLPTEFVPAPPRRSAA